MDNIVNDNFRLENIPPIEEKPQQTNVVIGFDCTIVDVCMFGDDEKVPASNYILKSDAEYGIAEEGHTCSVSNTHLIKYDIGNGEIQITNSTVVDLISGRNPQTNFGISPAISGCSDQYTPAQWTLQFDNSLNCQTVKIINYVSNTGGGGNAGIKYIFVNDGTCPTSDQIILKETYIPAILNNASNTLQNKIYFDSTLMFFFLSAIFITQIILFLKIRKKTKKWI